MCRKGVLALNLNSYREFDIISKSKNKGQWDSIRFIRIICKVIEQAYSFTFESSIMHFPIYYQPNSNFRYILVNHFLNTSIFIPLNI